MDFGMTDEALSRMAKLSARGLADAVADEALFVEFEARPVLNQAKSDKENRPVYDMVDHIRIMVPGDKNEVVDQPFWNDPHHPASHINRFRRRYEAWKRGVADQASGTPLSVLVDMRILTKADVKTYEFYNVRTAEQLVSVSDSNIQNFAGHFQMKQAVQHFLDKAKADAPKAQLMEMNHKLEAKSAEQDALIAQQNQALQDMALKLEAMSKAQKSKQ